MSQHWSGFSYIVINLARFVRPNEVTFSGVNSTLPMLACLLAKRAYEFYFVYINVACGVDPTPSKIPISSSDPLLAEGSTSIFANEDFYDLCTRGRMDLCFLGAAQIDGFGRTNVSCVRAGRGCRSGPWTAPVMSGLGGVLIHDLQDAVVRHAAAGRTAIIDTPGTVSYAAFARMVDYYAGGVREDQWPAWNIGRRPCGSNRRLCSISGKKASAHGHSHQRNHLQTL